MKEPSGKFVVRIPSSLHAALKRRSAEMGISLNQLCVRGLEQGADASNAIGTKPPSGSGGFCPFVPAHAVDSIRQVWGNKLVGVVLFGSAARDEPWMTSDIDLLIVLVPEAPITRALYEVWDKKLVPAIAKDLQSKLSPQFVRFPTDIETVGGLWYEVAMDGVLLWDTKMQVAGALRQLRGKIASGEIVRHFVHGHAYWVKPREAA